MASTSGVKMGLGVMGKLGRAWVVHGCPQLGAWVVPGRGAWVICCSGIILERSVPESIYKGVL